MGQKKKSPAARWKQSASSATAAATEVEPSSEISLYEAVGNVEPLDSAVVKLECEKALASFRRGSYTKAIRLMKESCSRHKDSALIHRVQGTLCVKVASVFEDQATKQKHLRNAIESARKAVELSPNSIEFAHFYANLLYEAANDAREYEEVLQECQRALSIEDPIDPAKESLQDENQHKISTPEARIAQVHDELKSLIQKSNLSSLSTADRKDRVRSYWNSMSKAMKRELLRVKVSDLKTHFSASKDGHENEIISEALSFCEANKTWRVWVCCQCSEKFIDTEAHMQHLVQEHMVNVIPKMQMVLKRVF